MTPSADVARALEQWDGLTFHVERMEERGYRVSIPADDLGVIQHVVATLRAALAAQAEEIARERVSALEWAGKCGDADGEATILHANNAALRRERDRLWHFLDSTVREWLSDQDDHRTCDRSCKYRAVMDAKYETLEAALAAVPGGA